MTVLDAEKQLIAVASTSSSEDELQRALDHFDRALTGCHDPEALLAVLDRDPNDDIPVPGKTAVFERLLALGCRTPAVLRRYADHLWLHGPESDDRVSELRAEADRLDGAH
jgi:hypothetical protein